jgi:hypothetical protein
VCLIIDTDRIKVLNIGSGRVKVFVSVTDSVPQIMVIAV